jgi:hypothetical protein
VSLIDPRYECDTCGGYRLPFRSTLSSVCKCPDYHPVTPGRHQIGGVTSSCSRVGGVRVEPLS